MQGPMLMVKVAVNATSMKLGASENECGFCLRTNGPCRSPIIIRALSTGPPLKGIKPVWPVTIIPVPSKPPARFGKDLPCYRDWRPAAVVVATCGFTIRARTLRPDIIVLRIKLSVAEEYGVCEWEEFESIGPWWKRFRSEER